MFYFLLAIRHGIQYRKEIVPVTYFLYVCSSPYWSNMAAGLGPIFSENPCLVLDDFNAHCFAWDPLTYLLEIMTWNICWMIL